MKEVERRNRQIKWVKLLQPRSHLACLGFLTADHVSVSGDYRRAFQHVTALLKSRPPFTRLRIEGCRALAHDVNATIRRYYYSLFLSTSPIALSSLLHPFYNSTSSQSSQKPQCPFNQQSAC